MTSAERKEISRAWLSVADEAIRDAERLANSSSWRSAANRSYYAAYSLLAAALVREPSVTFRSPADEPVREGPEHAPLSDLVGAHLRKRFGHGTTKEIRRAIGTLYLTRVEADYRPRAILQETRVKKGLKDVVIIEKAVKNIV
jgi:uncharacterized protein (UPF0332 family)